MVDWILRYCYLSTAIFLVVIDVQGQDTFMLSKNDKISQDFILLDSSEYRRILTLSQQAEVQFETYASKIDEVNRQNYWLMAVLVVLLTITTFLIFFVYRARIAKKTIEAQNLELNRKQEALAHTQVELEKTLRIAQDSTKSLRKYNQKLKSLQSQLIHAEKMSSLGQLTAGIVHEINNPMNFVRGGIEVIEKNLGIISGMLDEKQQAMKASDADKLLDIQEEIESELEYMQEFIPQVLKDILFGTSRISEIVNGLRIFSRQGESETKFSKLNDIINSSLLILRNQYTVVADLKIDFSPDIDEIECYPGLLNQVFVNIISNSIDAIGDKGRIWIKTIDLGDWVQVEVGDDGAGIAPEIRQHIFEPFFTTKEVGKGMGIGLSITYSIIRKHGGYIDVESSPDTGTIFKIMLKKELRNAKTFAVSEESVET